MADGIPGVEKIEHTVTGGVTRRTFLARLGAAGVVFASGVGAGAPMAREAFAMSGPVEPVPTMDSGLPESVFSVCVLGTLGSDLYLFGSQAESAGHLAGVHRYRDGVWTKLGVASRPIDYNRISTYGAREYNGNLYVGDRRVGNLYRLVLDGDTFRDVVEVAKVGGEDVFPGPVWAGQLMLGTFGRPWDLLHRLNPGVYAYDGSVVTHVLDLASIGSGGEVRSLIPYGDFLWVAAKNQTDNAYEVWRIDSSFTSERVYRGGTGYLLATDGTDLFGCTDAKSGLLFSSRPRWHVWRDSAFAPITPVFSPAGMNFANGAMAIGASLLYFDHYEGIWTYRPDGPSRLSPSPPRVTSAIIHDGYLWMTSNQPVRLYRMALA